MTIENAKGFDMTVFSTNLRIISKTQNLHQVWSSASVRMLPIKCKLASLAVICEGQKLIKDGCFQTLHLQFPCPGQKHKLELMSTALEQLTHALIKNCVTLCCLKRVEECAPEKKKHTTCPQTESIYINCCYRSLQFPPLFYYTSLSAVSTSKS